MSKTDVYANGLEIACKSSGGKSTASFPDPCFSPPSPSAGWIVIPYANTTKASDTANASKTVFIKGKPVMLKDRSYFSTSTGNEGAAGPKGVATGVKKGKAYFTSWSMDVKIEGYNVCRHTDLMTHNHGSVPGNTGTWHFLSDANKESCKDEMKRVEDACYDEDELDEKAQRRHIKGQLRRNKKKGGSKEKLLNEQVGPKTWKDKECLGALFPKDWLNKKPEEVEKKIEELRGKIDEYKNNLMDDLGNMAQDKLEDLDVGDLLSIDWTILCAGGYGVGKVACKALDLYWEIEEKIGDVIDAMSKVPGYLDDLKEGKLRESVTADMVEAAKENKCLQARKCMLVPYKHTLRGKNNVPKKELKSVTYKGKTYSEQTNGITVRNFLGLGYSAGCCPGQTGHHLIPSAWAKSACKPYSENKAPVVCAEGASQHDGTHKTLHDNLDDIVHEKYGLKRAKDKPSEDRKKDTKKIDKETAFENAIEAHNRMYPNAKDCALCVFSGVPCNDECLKAQLSEAYKDCKGDFTAQLITGNRGGEISGSNKE